jgi:hypothetical protein
MSWNNDLQAAQSPDDIIAAVNEFLFEQDERFWSAVPDAARVDAIDKPDQVHRRHHDLVQQLKAMKPASVELQELCVLFLRASVRLHQIDIRDRDRGTPSNDDLDCASASVGPNRFH